jgi:hypothetical protein
MFSQIKRLEGAKAVVVDILNEYNRLIPKTEVKEGD